MHRAARLLSAYASAFSSGEANRVRLRTAELRTTGHTRARGRAPEAKRSLTAAAGEFPSCVAIWRNRDNRAASDYVSTVTVDGRRGVMCHSALPGRPQDSDRVRIP